jgi:hypothetical protein
VDGARSGVGPPDAVGVEAGACFTGTNVEPELLVDGE